MANIDLEGNRSGVVESRNSTSTKHKKWSIEALKLKFREDIYDAMDFLKCFDLKNFEFL